MLPPVLQISIIFLFWSKIPKKLKNRKDLKIWLQSRELSWVFHLHIFLLTLFPFLNVLRVLEIQYVKDESKIFPLHHHFFQNKSSPGKSNTIFMVTQIIHNTYLTIIPNNVNRLALIFQSIYWCVQCQIVPPSYSSLFLWLLCSLSDFSSPLLSLCNLYATEQLEWSFQNTNLIMSPTRLKHFKGTLLLLR